jgi:hypothetical protein
VALALWLSRRFVLDLSRRAALLVALLPLVFTGRALLFGDLYGPSDLYYTAIPWKPLAAAEGVGAPANPILSDLAFANLPWRAAVREAFANGRLPLWNRFVLAGNPLLATAQAGVFHPSTWLGLWLPVPLSWTFSCTFTLFLALLSGFLFFRDRELDEPAALVGAVGWGFSTYVLFWLGWSVGPSTATFPLLLLGLSRLARRPDVRSVALTTAALWLAVCGGHPESLLHAVAAGAVYFLWELFASRGAKVLRSLGAALGAGILAALLAGPQLLPLLEAIPHSAEYRTRREAVRDGAARQSVPAPEALRRLLPDILPFAHGIYGRSAVQTGREDGSGMPLGYAGALLFPLAVLPFAGKATRRLPRGRWIFLAFALAGAGFGASFPGLLDAAARLPGFALALNYRLVFLAGLGVAGLAALGAQTVLGEGGRERLLRAAAGVAVVLVIAFLACLPVYADRGLDRRFVLSSFAAEAIPVVFVVVAAGGAARLRSRALLDVLLACLVLQRFFEMRSTYPTLPAATLAPALPTLAALPLGSDPGRIVAGSDVFRPNGSALYGLEDVRGYESLVLDRFADTWPLWSQAQAASFNRVPDLTRPFLSFLNARYAIGASDDETPEGWREQARGPEMAIFENPRALPRAFVPRRLRRIPDPRRRLEEMAGATDFAETAWLSAGGDSEQVNGEARIRLRAVGPDLVVEGRASSPAFVATSFPDWPGWVAEENGRRLGTETVDHAFVGFWLPAGQHTVRLTYRPRSWLLGLAASGAGLVLAGVLWLAARSATGRRFAS